VFDIQLPKDRNVSSIVELYLDTVCKRKIKYSQLRELEKLETNADTIEKKLINTLKSMITRKVIQTV
tara:strand:+ start:1592 stop:1792 length:201 start_codon:yes stop_codon:yes gene_type:complete